MRYTVPVSALTDPDRGMPFIRPTDPDLPVPVPSWARVDRAQLDKQPHPPHEDARALRYQDHAFFWDTFIGGELVPLFWYPTGQFIVPAGHTGIISRIDTHVRVKKVTLNQYNQPRMAYYALDYPIHYRLMLHPINNDQPQPHLWTSIAGVPHPFLGEWQDDRFSWGHFGDRLGLMVPENTILRLYAGIPALPPGGSVPDEIGGRLTGYTANYKLSPESILFSRTIA